MSKTEASTSDVQAPRRLADLAPYWALAGEPSGIHKLMQLGLHGAWRLALTLPDLVELGHGAEVARVLIHGAEIVAEARHLGELEVTIPIAASALSRHTVPGTCPIDLPAVVEACGDREQSEAMSLSAELLNIVHVALSGFGGGNLSRGSFLDSFAFYASNLATLSDDPRALFDELLEFTSQLFGESSCPMVDGYEDESPGHKTPAAATARTSKILPLRDRRRSERRRSSRRPASVRPSAPDATEEACCA